MTTRERRRLGFERRLGRWLIAVTYASVVALVVGVVLLVAGGRSPLDGGPPLDLATIVAGLAALDPAAFLWAGLLAVIATPVTRVLGAAAGFARTGEWTLVAVAAGILLTIGLSIASVLLTATP
ncbi:MAG: DUF1634 domain-containing protein [Candidatus Limnocylindria bacterium]